MAENSQRSFAPVGAPPLNFIPEYYSLIFGEKSVFSYPKVNGMGTTNQSSPEVPRLRGQSSSLQKRLAGCGTELDR
jgi:hypothetical protein